jgi:hypothetical protein
MIKKMMIFCFSLIIVGGMAFPLEKETGNSGKRVSFIDENGDGINDNLRDHDGDGIPNYKDPDWKRPRDGEGYRKANRIRNRRNRQQDNGDCSGFQRQSRINRFSRNRTGFNRASRVGTRAQNRDGGNGERKGKGPGNGNN